MARWRPHGRAADIALVLGVCAVAILGLLVQSDGLDSAAEWAALPVVLASSGALYFRRRVPIPVGVIALAGVAAYGALLQQPGPIMLVFVVALYTVVDEGHVAVAVGLGIASVLAFALADDFGRSQNGATFLHAGWLIAVIVGVTRNRRAYLSEARKRALAAQRQAAEDARREATEERLRIARDLHDVLGHHLSMINVQASAALHRPDPERSEAALAAIKDASKETLAELRAKLDVLRESEPPGLDRLSDLVRSVEQAGLTVRTEVRKTQPLPPAVDLVAYRIVQEALTNVTRHADTRTAVIRVWQDGDDVVVVEVEDDGVGAAGPAGNGIRGMDERARVLGGSLSAGPRPDGGFRVRAQLPLEPMPAGASA